MPSNIAPRYFRHALTDAVDSNDYANAGYHLAIHFEEHCEDDEDIESLHDLVRFPTQRITAARMWSWIEEILPACARLVPPESRDAFMRGVMEAVRKGRV